MEHLPELIGSAVVVIVAAYDVAKRFDKNATSPVTKFLKRLYELSMAFEKTNKVK